MNSNTIKQSNSYSYINNNDIKVTDKEIFEVLKLNIDDTP